MPVLLGTIGGLGLVVGPIGQWWQCPCRDPALGDPAQQGMNEALLLFVRGFDRLLALVKDSTELQRTSLR